jgi:hypothetical protein
MPNFSDNSFRLRVYFNFGESRKNFKNYELFHLANCDETFATLKKKVFEKRSIDPKLEPFFYFTLQRLHTIEKGGNCLRPCDHDSVCAAIEKEEMLWAGIIDDVKLCVPH